MGTWHLDIDEAIERGRIKAFYQPIVRVTTGECCGVEALARWQDPERGLLLPASFVPQLEAEKQIHKLDTCVMRTVCRDIRARLDAGETVVPVSVNVSRANFSMNDTVATVLEAVERYHVPKEKLVIEITESVAGESDLLSEQLAAFREAGFSVWMDDFGTGYSSLSALCDLDFDGLKLDMHFLMSGTEKGRVIIEHAVGMARALGMGTLAEGTTRAEDVEFLRRVGCERAQGAYYSQPRPLDDMLAHLRRRGIALER